MSCGCKGKQYSPFPTTSCQSSQLIPASDPYLSGITVVIKDFTVPAKNTDVDVTVSSTEPFYVGQGIKIGRVYYQITKITDANTFTLRHNGLGATPGNLVVAINPMSRCFQYQVYDANKVTLIPDNITIGGLDANGSGNGSVNTPIIDISLFGYTGIRSVEFELSFFAASVSAAAYFISVTLPAYTTHNIQASLISGSVYYREGVSARVDVPLIWRQGDTARFGPGGGVAFPSLSNVLFYASFQYEV